MKKIIGIIFISLMFANIGFAEMRLIDEKRINATQYDMYKYYLTTWCIDGHKFVAYKDNHEGITMTQFFEENDAGTAAVPAKC